MNIWKLTSLALVSALTKRRLWTSPSYHCSPLQLYRKQGENNWSFMLILLRPTLSRGISFTSEYHWYWLQGHNSRSLRCRDQMTSIRVGIGWCLLLDHLQNAVQQSDVFRTQRVHVRGQHAVRRLPMPEQVVHNPLICLPRLLECVGLGSCDLCNSGLYSCNKDREFGFN